MSLEGQRSNEGKEEIQLLILARKKIKIYFNFYLFYFMKAKCKGPDPVA
jgi:hypothetical protein